MGAKLSLSHFLVMSIFSLVIIQTANASSSGFCVPAGNELIGKNAILKVAEGQLNDGPQIVYPENQQFFDPKAFSTAELYSADGRGKMQLQKTGVVNGNVIEAIYENHMYGYNISSQKVNCIARKYTSSVDCSYLDCGTGVARPVWGKFCACFEF